MTTTDYINEIWSDIPGFEGLYRVSNRGRVLSMPRTVGDARKRKLPGRILSPKTDRGGYLVVLLYRPGSRPSTRTVHSLVAEAFIGPRPPGCHVLHGDDDPANCDLGNLRYGTPAENERDKIDHGRHPTGSRTACSAGHPYVDGSFRVRNRVRDGAPRVERVCLICRRVPADTPNERTSA